MHYAGKVVTHRQLLHEVWGEHADHDAHYLWVYMGQLRHKLEPDRRAHVICSPSQVSDTASGRMKRVTEVNTPCKTPCQTMPRQGGKEEMMS